MSAPNHCLRFRPLVGGVAILCPLVGEFGTLGAVVHDPENNSRWALSCAHVLAPEVETTALEPVIVFQPSDNVPENAIEVSSIRFDWHLDCAALQLPNEIDYSTSILGIGYPGQPLQPFEGMRVIKSGMTTGVTEGIIGTIENDRIFIENPFPTRNYDIALSGDSGAVWLDLVTRRPIGLHVSGTSGTAAQAISISSALAALKLAM